MLAQFSGEAMRMTAPSRYLHFGDIDCRLGYVHASCSRCGLEFTADRQPGETLTDAIARVRSEFQQHECMQAS